MEEVKKHICPTCGGNLIVNIERQMYECPFCGVTFDYDYFREESVLDIATKALDDKELASADRAYDFMLEKEPDNFEALRGKALIAMNITKIKEIRSLSLYSKIDYESVCKEIDRGIRSSKPQDREYFTIMKDIVDAGHEYVDKNAQLEIQIDERRESQDDLDDFVEERDTVGIYSPSGGRQKKAVIITIICYIICCLVIFLGFKFVTIKPYSKTEDLSQYETTQTEELEKNNKEKNIGLIVALSAATVIFVFVVILLIKWGKSLDTEISKIQAKADEQSEKIKNNEERIAELKDRVAQGYKRLCELHPVDEQE